MATGTKLLLCFKFYTTVFPLRRKYMEERRDSTSFSDENTMVAPPSGTCGVLLFSRAIHQVETPTLPFMLQTNTSQNNIA